MRQGRVDTIQISYNVTNRSVEDEPLLLAEELGTGVLVMEPLQKGRYVLDLKHQPDLTPLRDYGINTWAQALLEWVISDRRVSSAIPTTSRPERIQENAQAAEAAGLPQEFRDYIRFEAERSDDPVGTQPRRVSPQVAMTGMSISRTRLPNWATSSSRTCCSAASCWSISPER